MKEQKQKSITIKVGTLYDANKKLVNQTCKPMTEEELQKAAEDIAAWFKNNNIKYAMLLCNDIRYYTLFNIVGKAAFPYGFAANQCIGCLQDQDADILSIEQQENGAWEIWLKYEDEPKVFYLFDYKMGVIEC